MKNSNNEKIAKPSRQRYFHIIIYLRPKINLSKMNITSLVDFLLASDFPSQKILEAILYSLIITDRGRQIYTKNFVGQLERDSHGMPYWNVYLQTTVLITARRIARAISKELFKTEDLINTTISISPLSNFQQCDRKKLFSIPESDFYPGHFSRTILRFEELLRNKQIQETLKENPEKYRLLIETKE